MQEKEYGKKRKMQDHLTNNQLNSNGLSKWAVFLPAISGFYATFIGKQRNEQYVDPTRFPQGLADMEQMNWLNSQKALFPYKWSLYSGGHANLDLNKTGLVRRHGSQSRAWHFYSW